MEDLSPKVQQEILKEFKHNKDVFEKVYNFYYERILKYLLKRTISAESAYDLTAETFMKAFDNFHKFKWTGVSIKVWLYRIAINQLKNYRRKPKSTVLTQEMEGLEQMRTEVKEELEEIDKTQVHENELATILAASLQYKDQASEHWKNVVTYADSDELSNLYLLIYVKEGLAHADSRNVSFNVKAGNLDENKTLGGCKVFSALVNGTKGIQIDNIKGDLSAVVFYEKAVAPSEFKQDKRLGITRKYEIVGDKARTEMHVDDIVRVTLNFSIDDSLPDDKSYHIVDIVPSGLQVLEKPIGFSEYGDNRYIGHANEIYNQEIHFRYYKNPNSTGLTRTYYAKVITPGKFYADPAKIEMFDDPEIANISAPNTVSISEIIE